MREILSTPGKEYPRCCFVQHSDGERHLRAAFSLIINPRSAPESEAA
jgi:hypothetical protein